jgi:hypothetical protein
MATHILIALPVASEVISRTPGRDPIYVIILTKEVRKSKFSQSSSAILGEVSHCGLKLKVINLRALKIS